MVDLRLGRVNIFGNVFIAFERTAAKGDYTAGKAMYRKHNAARGNGRTANRYPA